MTQLNRTKNACDHELKTTMITLEVPGNDIPLNPMIILGKKTRENNSWSQNSKTKK